MKIKMKLIRNLFLVTAVSLLLFACSAMGPINASDNPIGSKIGYSQGTSFLFFWFGNMDLGIVKAAKQGGITKVATVDYKFNTILGIINTYTVIVTGE